MLYTEYFIQQASKRNQIKSEGERFCQFEEAGQQGVQDGVGWDLQYTVTHVTPRQPPVLRHCLRVGQQFLCQQSVVGRVFLCHHLSLFIDQPTNIFIVFFILWTRSGSYTFQTPNLPKTNF